jgi:hypothetical protein
MGGFASQFHPDWPGIAVLVSVVGALLYRWNVLRKRTPAQRLSEAEAFRTALLGSSLPSALFILISPFDDRLLAQALNRSEYLVPMAAIIIFVSFRDLTR